MNVEGIMTTYPEDALVDHDFEQGGESACAPAQQAPFVVDTPEKANWVVRKIVAARVYREHVKRWAAEEGERATKEEERLLFLFGRQLEDWTTSEIAKAKGRRKSVNLPAGQTGFRRVGPTVVVDDDGAVLDWAKQCCPAAIVVLEKLSKSGLNEHIERSGELPPKGVHIEPARESFFVR